MASVEQPDAGPVLWSTPTERRLLALSIIMDDFFDGAELRATHQGLDRTEISNFLKLLHGLGRGALWLDCIDRWRLLVLDQNVELGAAMQEGHSYAERAA